MKRTIASRAVGRGLAKVEPTNRNTLIAYASKAGSTAADGEGKNSPFSAALAKHVTKPGLDLRKAFGYVRDGILKSTGNRQEPYVYGSLGGDDLPLVPAVLAVPAAPVTTQAGTSICGQAWPTSLPCRPGCGTPGKLFSRPIPRASTPISPRSSSGRSRPRNCGAADKAAERARLADGKSAPAESRVAVLQPSAAVVPSGPN